MLKSIICDWCNGPNSLHTIDKGITQIGSISIEYDMDLYKCSDCGGITTTKLTRTKNVINRVEAIGELERDCEMSSNRLKIIVYGSSLDVGDQVALYNFKDFLYNKSGNQIEGLPKNGIAVIDGIENYEGLDVKTKYRFYISGKVDLTGWFYDTEVSFVEPGKLKTVEDLIDEFNKYFTSGNSVDVNQRIMVPRDEWRILRDSMIKVLDGNADNSIVSEEDVLESFRLYPVDFKQFNVTKEAKYLGNIRTHLYHKFKGLVDLEELRIIIYYVDSKSQ